MSKSYVLGIFFIDNLVLMFIYTSLYIVNKNKMHNVFGKFIKYVFWLALIFIVGLLLVGLSKSDWNVKWYVQSLNDKSRTEAWEAWGISGIFWSEVNEEAEENVEVLTGDEENLDIEEGLDVYDPSFEEWLNNIPKEDLEVNEDVEDEEFGFVIPEGWDDELTWDVEWDAKDDLLDLLKEREME